MRGYTCRCCGTKYDELPTYYASDAPVYYYDFVPSERSTHFEMNDDLCVMNGEHFFIHGNIEIPIIGTDDVLTWSVWTSLSETNFVKVLQHWENQDELEPMFGWLSTDISCYPDTINIKTMVHFQGNRTRPFIIVEPTSHPLSMEFHQGITKQRIQEIAEQLCVNNKSKAGH